MATVPKPRFTFDDYLDGEEHADYKSEFHSGEIFAMSGGSLVHAQLGTRIGGLFDRAVSDGCRVYSSDLNLRIESIDKGIYPDCMVICGEPMLWNKRNAVLNPVIAVEVLSPSTKNFDHGTKLFWYQSVPSLQHIILVSQDMLLVDHYSRTSANSWTMTRYSGEEECIHVMGMEINVGDIYRNIL